MEKYSVFFTVMHKANGALILGAILKGSNYSPALLGYADHNALCEAFNNAQIAFGEPGELNAWPQQNHEYLLTEAQLSALGIYVNLRDSA
jgi:hypothetical protein